MPPVNCVSDVASLALKTDEKIIFKIVSLLSAVLKIVSNESI